MKEIQKKFKEAGQEPGMWRVRLGKETQDSVILTEKCKGFLISAYKITKQVLTLFAIGTHS